MTVEYLASGIKCDLSCKYCYQNNMREAGNFAPPTEWSKVRDTIARLGVSFTVFGGEALVTPKPHLEEVFKFGYDNSGHNGIQTNLLRLDADHIAMFKKYNVNVGVSIDGYWPQNSPRSTKEQTEKIIENIAWLLDEGVVPSIIITVHRANGLYQYLHRTIDFVSWLTTKGVNSLNFHVLETDNDEIQRTLGLTNEENLIAFTELYTKFGHPPLYAAPFSDIRNLLAFERPVVNCTWNACDVLTTPAVQGVMPDGSLSNCGRTNKDGVNWVKNSDAHKGERYIALYHTPQEHGGCKDCRYFFACKGQCPGTAIDNDWRNKTVHCEFWYGLIEFIHNDMMDKGLTVLSMERMREMGKEVLTGKTGHQDSPHIDSPHVDWHEDHTDTTKVYTIQELIDASKLQA